MQADFWHRRWAKNEIAFHQAEVNGLLRRFWDELAVEPGSTILVPLCGKSLDMAWIVQRGHSVLGIELSAAALEAFFHEQHIEYNVYPQPPFTEYVGGGCRLLCGDFFALTEEHLKDVAAVYDRASLIAFPPEMRAAYARHLCTLLSSRAPVFLLTLEYPQHEIEGPPFAVTEDEVRTLFGEHYSVEAIHSREALADNPRFRERGLTSLEEKLFLLRSSKKPADV